MKAVILSGGAGTRLAPISTRSPKPLAMLPGAPVLEYLIKLLKRHGIEDITLAVCHLSQQIEEHFLDGSSLGVRLTYVREEKPLGTAGAVRMCIDDAETEPVIILSGDAVCDFDLTKCIEFHKSHSGGATILLHRSHDVRQYGLVMCGRDSKVLRFVEKPSWPQVFGSFVNTGIYILDPELIRQLPRGENADFAKDLFPRLLDDGKAIHGFEPGGYWRDIGSCEAYHQACMDIIARRTKLECPQSHDAGEGVRVIAPSYIGDGVRIGKGSVIGPLACIQPGSIIGEGCRIERSVICSACVGDSARITGSVVCSGASVGSLCRVNEGCVVGDGAVLAKQTVLAENVKVWPGRKTEPHSTLRTNLVFYDYSEPGVFTDAGIMRSSTGIDAQFCAKLGSVLATAGSLGISHTSSDFAACLSDAVASGARIAGCRVYTTDAVTPAAADMAALMHGLERSVFIDIDGEEVIIYISGPMGRALTRSEEHSIEGALRRGEWPSASPRSAGSITQIRGISAAHARAALDAAPGEGAGEMRLCSFENDGALGELLTMAGAKSTPNSACVRLTRSGRGLRLFPGANVELPPYTTRLLAARLLLDRGHKAIAAHPLAPMGLDQMVRSEGARLIMPGSEGYTDAMKQSRALLDGLFCASLILRATASQPLSALLERIPHVYTAGEDISLSSHGTDVMGLLSAHFVSGARFENGIITHDSRGWVRITPLAGLKTLRVAAEAASMEAAKELCGDIKELTQRLDRENLNK